MQVKLAIGQKVRFNKRVVLSPRVPKNSNGYTHAVLVPIDGDAYEGTAIVEKGTEAEVIDYASHGTSTSDVPIVRVKGVNARVHAVHLNVD